MLELLRHPVFARLFAAQVVALLGTGLMTVALALLAWDIAGAEAGRVLGTALAIKMVAYVVLSPVAQALSARLPRRAVLIGADIIRGGAALALPAIDAVWQIYALIFVLQAASATFTPAFQATIPDVLSDEARYTRALSLSRLAYDLESLASPALAAALLAVTGYGWLFFGTAAGFLASAGLVASLTLPVPGADRPRPFAERLTRGARIYLATPRLRGLLALTLAAASAGAFVIVDTVVLVRETLGRDEGSVAVAFAAFGAGSMAAALALPRLLERLPDRAPMLAAGTVLALLLAGLGLLLGTGAPAWPLLLALWALAGAAYAGIVTPAGRLIRRSAREADRPALFAAQFALSHAGWLVTYPLAGWLGASAGLGPAALALAGLAALGTLAAWRLWPAGDPVVIPHEHPDLPPDHPHLAGAENGRHAHAFVIDDAHPYWPGR